MMKYLLRLCLFLGLGLFCISTYGQDPFDASEGLVQIKVDEETTFWVDLSENSQLVLDEFSAYVTDETEVHIFATSIKFQNTSVDYFRYNSATTLSFGDYDFSNQVENPVATYESYNKVNVTWDAMANADGYLIFRDWSGYKDIEKSPYEVVGFVEGETSFLDDAINYDLIPEGAANPTYYIMAYSISNDGNDFITKAVGTTAINDIASSYSFDTYTDDTNEAIVGMTWSIAESVIQSSTYNEVYYKLTNTSGSLDQVVSYHVDDLENELIVINGMVQGAHAHYATPYSSEDYTFQVFEAVSGKLMYEETIGIDLSSASPAVNLSEVSVEDDRVNLQISPSSAMANAYQIWRTTLSESGEPLLEEHLTTLDAVTIDKSAYFDGTADDFIDVGSSFGSSNGVSFVPWGSWSMSISFKYEETGTNQILIGSRAIANQDVSLRIGADGSLAVIRRHNNRTSIVSDYVSPSEWHTIILTNTPNAHLVDVPNSGLTVYLDGVKVTEYLKNGYGRNQGRWSWGFQNLSSQTNPFKGQIAQVSSIGRVLTEDEVAVYHNSIHPKMDVVYFDGDGLNFYDNGTKNSNLLSDVSTVNVGIESESPTFLNRGVLTEEIFYSDSFNIDYPSSIVGGSSYTYEVIPYLNTASYLDDKADATAIVTSNTKDLLFITDGTSTADQIDLSWDISAFSENIDTVLIYRDGVAIDKVVGTAAYSDKTFTYGKTHNYGVVPIKNNLPYFAQYADGTHVSNGVISGYFVDENGYVVPNSTLSLSAFIDDNEEYLTVTSDVDGAFSLAQIYYADEASYTWENGSVVTFSRNAPIITNQFEKVAASFNISEGEIISDLLIEEHSDSGQPDRTLKLSWQAVEPSYYTSIYRDDQLIHIGKDITEFIDTDGLPNTLHTYTVAGYTISGDDLVLTTLKDEFLYPELLEEDISIADTELAFAVPELEITYPPSYGASKMELYRDATLIHEWSDMGSGITVFKDTLGIPGLDYTYHVLAYDNQGTEAISSDIDLTYPVMDVSNLMDYSNLLPVYWDFPMIEFDDGTINSGSNYDNWDGILMRDKDDNLLLTLHEGHEEEMAIYAFENDIDEIRVYAFKYTHGEIFESSVLTTLSVNYSTGSINSSDIMITSGDGFVKVDWSGADIQSRYLTLIDDEGHSKTVLTELGAWSFFYDNIVPESINLSISKSGKQVWSKTNQNVPGNWTDKIENPQNVVASQGSDGYVLVSWDYPEEYSSGVTFKVWRDDLTDPIAELQSGQISYLDTSIPQAGKAYAYQVAAYYKDQHSQRVGAIGYNSEWKMIDGMAYDENGKGIPNMWISLQEPYRVTMTDSTGYFQFDSLSFNGSTSVDIHKSFNGNIISQETVSLSASKRTTVDFHLNGEVFIPHLSIEEVANIFAIEASIDPIDWNTKYRWQTTSDKYTGFEIQELPAVVADYDRTDGLSYSDNGGASGQNYTYGVQPYFRDVNGDVAVGEYAYTSSDYPSIVGPSLLSASPLAEDGKMLLQWSHPSNRVDGFIIYKNDEELERVLSSDLSEYTDDEGPSSANGIERYKVTSYLVNAEGTEIESTSFAATQVSYPTTPGVASITVSPEEDQNRVKLTWSYFPEAIIDGVKIYRGEDGDEELAILDYSAMEAYDSLATPGQNTTYSISTYRDVNDQRFESLLDTASTLFPELDEVDNLLVSSGAKDLTITWDYTGDGIDYFEVRIDGPNALTGDVNQFDEVRRITYDPNSSQYSELIASGFAGGSYTIGVKAVAIRDEVVYYSTEEIYGATFPNLPTPVFTTANSITATNFADLNWDYDFDSFDYFELEVKETGGSTYTEKIDPSKRRYRYLPDHSAGLSSPISVAFKLTAHQEVSNAISSNDQVAASISYSKKNSSVNLIVDASEDESGYVRISWDLDDSDLNMNDLATHLDGGVKIYRNGQLIETLNTLAQNEYLDYDGNIGEEYVYEVEILVDFDPVWNALFDFMQITSAVLKDVSGLCTSQGNNGIIEMLLSDELEKFTQVETEWEIFMEEELMDVFFTLEDKITDSNYQTTGTTLKAVDPYNPTKVYFNPIVANLAANSDVPKSSYLYGYNYSTFDNMDWGLLNQRNKILANINLNTDKLYPITSEMDKGQRIGDGKISGSVISSLGTGIADVGIRVASVDKLSEGFYTDTVYTDGNGEFQFNEVVYGVDDIAYKVSVLGNGDYEPEQEEVFLNENNPSFTSLTFVDQTSYTLTGTLKYTCEGCLLTDSIYVEYIAYNQNDEEIGTDYTIASDGTYSFALSPNDEISYVELSIDPEYYQDSEDGGRAWIYQFDETSVNIVYSDISNSGSYNHDFVDQTVLPAEISLRTVCGAITGYQFKIRLESELYSTVAYTNTSGSLSVDLPPYNFSALVIGAEPKDAYSATVSDYFRSSPQYFNYQDDYTTFSGEYDDTYDLNESIELFFEDPINLTYHKTPEISISGWSEYTCNSPFYPITKGPTSSSSGVDVSLTFNAVENFGMDCNVDEGYFIVKNPGAEITIDTVEFNHEEGKFNRYTFTPSYPNLIVPYTHLLEVNYYGSDHDFKGSATQEFIVTGEAAVPGGDVLVNPNGGTTNFPLVVLRDPPGDNSYSYVEEGSELSYNFSVSKTEATIFNATADLNTVFPGGTQIVAGFKAGTDNTVTSKNSYSLNIKFNEKLSTSGKSQISTNLKGYLDGREAGIVGGMGASLAYSIKQRVTYDNCEIAKNNTLGIDLSSIETVWFYTISQIENTINYYDALINDESVDGLEGIIEEDSYDEGSAISVKEWLINSSANWQNIVDYFDKYSLPPCEMCEYARDRSAYWDGDVKSFCKSYVYANASDENDYCSTLDISSWDQSAYDEYNEAHKDFLALFYKKIYKAAYKDEEDLDVEDIDWRVDFNDHEHIAYLGDVVTGSAYERIALFDPLENITLSSGVKLSRSINSSSSESEFTGRYFADHGGIYFGAGYLADKDINTVVIENKLFKLNILGKFKFDWKNKSQKGSKETTKSSYKVGYQLYDDDDGDHFNVSVFHSPFNYETNLGPYFHLRGGRSSAPYEEGSISRDEPKLLFQDETGEKYPTTYYDLDPDGVFEVPLLVSSGNLFYEDRVIGVSTPAQYNTNAAELFIENVEIYNGRSAQVFTEAENDGITYTKLLITPKQGIYDYNDLAIVARPWGVKDKLWSDGSHVFDTLHFELHYRKPVSPVAIQDREAGWVINKSNESFLYYLEDYVLDSSSFSLKNIVMEYKRDGLEDWFTMTDEYDLDNLTLEYLQDFYDENINTYPEPTYPFAWNASSLDLIDGVYHIRATSFHDNGSFDFSNIYTGIIDRTAPEIISNRIQPHDGVFSELDEIKIEFTEEMDANVFETDSLTIYNISGLTPVEVPRSDYVVHSFSGSLEVILSEGAIEENEGDTLQVILDKGGVQDVNGNALDTDFNWSFVVDYHKETPSPIEWVTTEFLINTTNDHESFPFVFTGYDVYQTTYGLDSIILQSLSEGATGWINLDTITLPELLANYQLISASGSDEIDTLWWDNDEFQDGNYDVRLAVYSEHNIGYSGTLSGIIDTTALRLIEVSPDDNIFSRGEQIMMVFDETIICEQEFTVSLTNESNSGADLNSLIETVCFDNQLVFNKQGNWAEYYTDTLKLSVTGLVDNNGNSTDTSMFFVVDYQQLATSPVDIESIEDSWYMSNEKDSVELLISGFDLMQFEFGLDSILVECKLDNPTVQDWTVLASLPTDTLKKYATYMGSDVYHSMIWHTKDDNGNALYSDGDYIVRAISYYDHVSNVSSGISGSIDLTDPIYTGTYSPSDGTVTPSTPITFMFTEPIDLNSLNASTIQFLDMGIAINSESSTSSAGRSTTIVIQDEYYVATSDGTEIVIYPTNTFFNEYDGNTVEVSISKVTDEFGNYLTQGLAQQYNIHNDGSLGVVLGTGTNLNGRQTETGSIELTWVNPVSMDNQEYDIERSMDGTNFQVIGVQEANADEYIRYDYVNFDKVVYYRLNQRDTDGNTLYSRTVAIADNGVFIPLQVVFHPNPVVRGTALNISLITRDLITPAKIELINLMGDVVWTNQFEESELSNTNNELIIPTSLSGGLYYLRTTQGVFEHTEKVIIE